MGDDCSDFCAHLFCSACAMTQEHREIQETQVLVNVAPAVYGQPQMVMAQPRPVYAQPQPVYQQQNQYVQQQQSQYIQQQQPQYMQQQQPQYVQQQQCYQQMQVPQQPTIMRTPSTQFQQNGQYQG
jgi:hypothetical protein